MHVVRHDDDVLTLTMHRPNKNNEIVRDEPGDNEVNEQQDEVWS